MQCKPERNLCAKSLSKNNLPILLALLSLFCVQAKVT
jgi:hypothetical protein